MSTDREFLILRSATHLQRRALATQMLEARMADGSISVEKVSQLITDRIEPPGVEQLEQLSPTEILAQARSQPSWEDALAAPPNTPADPSAPAPDWVLPAAAAVGTAGVGAGAIGVAGARRANSMRRIFDQNLSAAMQRPGAWTRLPSWGKFGVGAGGVMLLSKLHELLNGD